METATSSRIIDLTLTYRPGMRGYDCSIAKTKSRDGWNARTLSLYTHSGTHMDAPLHFIDGGGSIDELDLQKCVGPCLVIDIGPVEPRELITPVHLGRKADRLAAGSRLILKTGWSDRVGSPDYRDALPRISVELARWLVERGVAFLGVEPPSVADVNNLPELTEVHEILLAGGVVIAEGLCNLDQLSRDEVEIVALPLKPEGADGSPARIIAIERA